MIIWGSRGKEKILAEGQFFCPGCGVLRPYHHKRIARYFTLYFIPLFETRNLGEYIECQVCFTPYRTEILQHSKSLEQESELQKQIQELIKNISDQLEAGISVQAITSTLKNIGANEDVASAAIYASTQGKIKVCQNCHTAYKASLSYCSLCGGPLSLDTLF
jgi:hypothetical protein